MEISNTIGKPNYLKCLLTILVVLSATAFTQKTSAQTVYGSTSASQIKVSGTSNLHDWDMLASKFTCNGTFIVEGGQLQDISSLSFVLPVKNLKSKETLMDTRTYKALKAGEHDQITFKLTEATVSASQKTIRATGNLTIAGVSNQVVILTNYVINQDESITCKGSKLIKMNDYNMKAPSFILGALKTGNEVTIDMLLILKKR